MSKRKPMCQIPVNHLCISVDDYRTLAEAVQSFRTGNRDLYKDLQYRISEIDRLEKELEEVKEELSRAKNAEDIWYRRSREFEDKLKALERKSDASPENS